MKTPALVAAVLFVASQIQAASTGITLKQSTVPKPTESKPAAPADAAAASDEKAVVKKPEEAKPKATPEPVIPGTTFARPKGGFLGFEVVGGQVKVSFYDKKKKAVAIDVIRGVARWPDPRGNGQVRTPLNPSGTALIGVKPALPPFNYSITFQLLMGEEENAEVVESYTVPFRG